MSIQFRYSFDLVKSQKFLFNKVNLKPMSSSLLGIAVYEIVRHGMVLCVYISSTNIGLSHK